DHAARMVARRRAGGQIRTGGKPVELEQGDSAYPRALAQGRRACQYCEFFQHPDKEPMRDLLPCETVEPANGKSADAAVIWLHGLGASGHDFLPLLPELGLSEDLAIRFVFPHAPSIPVTINGGYVMPAWYDITSLGEERHFNAHQLLASAAAVHQLIDREMARGIASERILLAGFSQGGAVNFQAGLTYDKPLGGMLALSTYFPTAEAVEV